MNKMLKKIIASSVYVLGVLILVYLMVTYVGRRIIVDGNSMEPTLYNQDNLIVDKITYRFREPERFDIIVIPARYQPEVNYIKRIIGLPGETVFINENGYIYINGELLEETYGMEAISSDSIGRAAQPITLKEDEYFVLGDNRNDSLDSRSPAVGNVHRTEITGRAWFRVWPLQRFGLLKHR